MNVEQQVANYYTHGKLEDKIMGVLRSAGKNVEQLHADDLAAIDEFHLGGRVPHPCAIFAQGWDSTDAA